MSQDVLYIPDYICCWYSMLGRTVLVNSFNTAKIRRWDLSKLDICRISVYAFLGSI